MAGLKTLAVGAVGDTTDARTSRKAFAMILLALQSSHRSAPGAHFREKLIPRSRHLDLPTPAMSDEPPDFDAIFRKNVMYYNSLEHASSDLDEELFCSQNAHGTCPNPVPSNLRWGCDSYLADSLCCFNRERAEERFYFQETSFVDSLYEDEGEPITFYDSVTSEPLFKAPVDRDWDDFLEEAYEYGWPSFRDSEVLWDNVVLLQSGEVVSASGTHLGHNIPDYEGNNRFCINILCIAGQPPSKPTEDVASFVTSRASGITIDDVLSIAGANEKDLENLNAGIASKDMMVAPDSLQGEKSKATVGTETQILESEPMAATVDGGAIEGVPNGAYAVGKGEIAKDGEEVGAQLFEREPQEPPLFEREPQDSDILLLLASRGFNVTSASSEKSLIFEVRRLHRSEALSGSRFDALCRELEGYKMLRRTSS